MKKSIFVVVTFAFIIAITGCAYNPNAPANRRLAGLSQLKIGMPQGQALAMVGQPIRVNQTITASGASQQYVYSSEQFQTPQEQFLMGMQQGVDGVSHQRDILLYFQNGRLTAIQK